MNVGGVSGGRRNTDCRMGPPSFLLFPRLFLEVPRHRGPPAALGVNSIDILDGLNPSLNHFSIQCLPKRVLNLALTQALKILNVY